MLCIMHLTTGTNRQDSSRVKNLKKKRDVFGRMKYERIKDSLR